MAIGFSPNHKETLYLDKFTPRQFLTLAYESAKKLDWDIQFISETGFIALLHKGRFKWNAEITFKIDDDQAIVKSKSVGNELIDFGKNRRTVEKFRDALIDFKYALSTEELDRKFVELKPTMSAPENDILKQPPQTTIDKFRNTFSMFIPREGYFVTPIIIDINILIYLVMVISGVHFFQPDGESLLKWGANFRPVTMEGEWWRLITCCFVHIGIVHLLMNMYALLYIGILLEPRIGSVRFAAAYLITGITASVTSLCWHDLIISAGASGAIFGMYGLFLALLTTNLIEKKTRKDLLVSIGIFVGYNLMYGMKGGIDNAAHIGGLIGGIIIGFSFYPSMVKPELKTRNALIGSTVLIGISILSVFFIAHTTNPIGKYNQIMNEFAKAEERAMSFYRVPENSPDEVYLKAIKEEGIPNWETCKKLVNSIDSIEELPEDVVYRTSIVKRYCDCRITSFNLLAESIERNSNTFDFMILYYNQKIDLIIRKLNGEEMADSLLIVNPVTVLMPNLPAGILYVVDGTPTDDINSVQPESIKDIFFLKPEASYRLYGDRGRVGALIIQTK